MIKYHPIGYLLISKKKIDDWDKELWRLLLNKVKIASLSMWQSGICACWWDVMGIGQQFCRALHHNVQLNLIGLLELLSSLKKPRGIEEWIKNYHKKYSDKVRIWDILNNNWPSFLKISRKKKGRLLSNKRDYQILKNKMPIKFLTELRKFEYEN